MDGPLIDYEAMLMRGEITFDPYQGQAVELLQEIYRALKNPKKQGLFRSKPQAVKGAYLYGGGGRGKSMIMDLFFKAVKGKTKARRLHFHEFMLETHDWLHSVRGDRMDDLLPRYAKHVVKSTDVLCFDEFHVVDVADAMILSRLFGALFEKGVTVIATSNWPPERLYEGGLQRDRFEPFIDLLQSYMTVLHLESDMDYRTVAEADLDTYLYPLGPAADQKADELFQQMSGGAEVEPKIMSVKGRDIVARAAGGIARFTFAELCEQPHGAEDYLKIAENFETLFLEHIPKMGYDRRNELKRLMTLIDVVYDKGKRLVVTADAPPERLYYGKDHAFEFERTISRLNEMRSSSYVGNSEELGNGTTF